MNRIICGEERIVRIGSLEIGGKNPPVFIAGPCAVESREQIVSTAQKLKEIGVNVLRGGVFKPRSSPYSFQGLGFQGLEYLREAGDVTGLPIVTEIIEEQHIELMSEKVDVLQVGSRNMYNYSLLKALGKVKNPIILKRGFSATIDEWLMSAEYLASHGNENIILCERGIRTFNTYSRNTLDLNCVPIVKMRSGLPIIVDPSHGTGIRELVLPMSKAALACGADGLMIEVHPKPEDALSDGEQSLTFEQYKHLYKNVTNSIKRGE